MLNELVIKSTSPKKTKPFLFLWKDLTCLIVKSHYGMTNSLTANFPINFHETVNLTLTLTSFYQPVKVPTVKQILAKDIFNLGFTAFL